MFKSKNKTKVNTHAHIIHTQIHTHVWHRNDFFAITFIVHNEKSNGGGGGGAWCEWRGNALPQTHHRYVSGSELLTPTLDPPLFTCVCVCVCVCVSNMFNGPSG